MKNSLAFLVLFAATILLSLILPWWIIAPMSFAYSYFLKPSAVIGFFVPFAAIFLAWFLSIHFVDNGIVADLMGKLFQVGSSLTPVIASMLGAIVAGLFGWSGSLLREQKKSAIS
ncbi:MAG: hypothetical protein ACPGTP_02510 [Bacteroidia bacterium]